MITTVLLDAGGVILDESEHERVRIAIATSVLRRVSPGYSEGMLLDDLDEAVEVFCPRVLAYVFWKRVRPEIALFTACYQSFLTEWKERRPPLKLMPGIENEVPEIAARFKIGIAGQYGGDLLSLLEEEDLLRYFAYRLTQDDFDITKPDPRYLERIAAACGVEPKECIMVGDRIDNDIIPAKQIGMKTILVRGGLHRKQIPRIPAEMPDEEIVGIAGLGDAVARVGSARSDIDRSRSRDGQ
jgi:FMN phosphatase YigB (HAD superfamily)